jgi:ABC-type proline/glycine betaine transport system permease subunit
MAPEYVYLVGIALVFGVLAVVGLVAAERERRQSRGPVA